VKFKCAESIQKKSEAEHEPRHCDAKQQLHVQSDECVR
jgi:hypothetical protein